ncbi:MAG: hypothetical protein BGO41_05310 [Clostridiales bacterium 38-18]|nr:MAG: hypothetical protein BGO41_05310 [Clostridiales bacterium 38-18]
MRLIVADDSAFVRNIIQKSLSTSLPEAEIVLCTNGKEALDAYVANPSDWVVTDLLMPEMTGQELISKLYEITESPKVIVISADVQKGTKDELDTLGVQNFINKPLNADKLEALKTVIIGS